MNLVDEVAAVEIQAAINDTPQITCPGTNKFCGSGELNK